MIVFSKDSPVPFIAPPSFDALCRLLPFPFCLQTPEVIATSEESSGHPGIWDRWRRQSAGHSPPPRPAACPLFSMRAGRELAELQLPRHRAVAAAAFSARRRSHAPGAVTTVGGGEGERRRAV